MADRSSGTSQDHQSVPKLLYRLLVLILFVILFGCAFLILFGCGQLALNAVSYQTAQDTRSKLQADYGAWPVVMIPAIDSAIIEDIRRDEQLNPTVIGARPFWPTSDRPTATRPPTLIAQQPTSTPAAPTGTPTFITTPTPTPQPTRTATPYPTRTIGPTSTTTPWPTATETPWPTATSRPPQPNTRTHTPTPVTPGITVTPTSTSTVTPVTPASDTPTATTTPTPTSSFTPTATPTETPTPTDTSTPTSTATLTPTPTATPNNACPGSVPAGEPNIGLPNGVIAQVQCGGDLLIDLGSQRITTHTGYDFIYYEQAACSGICLDWVQVEVCPASGCASGAVIVFTWGDDIPDTNTNVASYAAGGEQDNEDIPASALHCANGYCTGIEIDVDAFGPVPPGGYRYIHILSPYNWPDNDGSEIDSLYIEP